MQKMTGQVRLAMSYCYRDGNHFPISQFVKHTVDVISDSNNKSLIERK